MGYFTRLLPDIYQYITRALWSSPFKCFQFKWLQSWSLLCLNVFRGLEQVLPFCSIGGKGSRDCQAFCMALGIFFNLRILQLVKQSCFHRKQAVSWVRDLMHILLLFLGPQRAVGLWTISEWSSMMKQNHLSWSYFSYCSKKGGSKTHVQGIYWWLSECWNPNKRETPIFSLQDLMAKQAEQLTLHFRGALLHLLSFSRALLGDTWLDFQCSCCLCLKHHPRIAFATVSCLSASVYVSKTWRLEKEETWPVQWKPSIPCSPRRRVASGWG